jgi:transcriptional regulator with XRE-family HTH domain
MGVCEMTKNKLNDMALEVRTHQATREALDCVSELFDLVSHENDISRAELAEKIQRDPSYISRILNGRVSNVNYQTLARMILAMGYWPTLKAMPLELHGNRSNSCSDTVESPNYKLTTSANNFKRKVFKRRSHRLEINPECLK